MADYSKRINRWLLKKVLSGVFAMLLVALPIIFLNESSELLVFSIGIVSGSVVLILGLILLVLIVLARVAGGKLLVIIDENSIIRTINLINENNINPLQQCSCQNNNTPGGNCLQILFKDITSIEEKNGNLTIKSKYANSFSGNHTIVIPQEIDKYEEIKQIISDKTKIKLSWC